MSDEQQQPVETERAPESVAPSVAPEAATEAEKPAVYVEPIATTPNVGDDAPHVGHDLAHLAALQPPNEVPCEERAVGGDLLGEVLGAVLPHKRYARRRQLPHLPTGHILGGSKDLHLLPTPSGFPGGRVDFFAHPPQVLGDSLRVEILDQLRHAKPA